MTVGTPPPPTVGSLIRTLRRKLDLSQTALGRRVGRSQQWLSKIEQDRREPSLPDLRRLANALGVETTDLVPAPTET